MIDKCYRLNKARRNDAVGELDDNNEKIYNDLNDKNK